MANLLIICDNKRQVRNLFYRTINHLEKLGRSITFNGVYFHVIDHYSGDQVRFGTLYDINRKRIDDGYHGVRMEGRAYDYTLTKQEWIHKEAKDDGESTNL